MTSASPNRRYSKQHLSQRKKATREHVEEHTWRYADSRIQVLLSPTPVPYQVQNISLGSDTSHSGKFNQSCDLLTYLLTRWMEAAALNGAGWRLKTSGLPMVVTRYESIKSSHTAFQRIWFFAAASGVEKRWFLDPTKSAYAHVPSGSSCGLTASCRNTCFDRLQPINSTHAWK